MFAIVVVVGGGGGGGASASAGDRAGGGGVFAPNDVAAVCLLLFPGCRDSLFVASCCGSLLAVCFWFGFARSSQSLALFYVFSFVACRLLSALCLLFLVSCWWP